ncbi:MAG: ABC-type transport auxiliary lipoprotein family protein [Pseudomonadota bacterium]
MSQLRAMAMMLAALPLMVGCSGLLKSTAPDEQVYFLHPAAAPTAAAPVNAMLVVPQPEVQPALNTSRIALTQPGNRLDYFAGSRWAGSLSQELGALTVQSLVAMKTFAVVAATDPGAGAGDFQLLLTVRHFEAEYSGDASGMAPAARVSIECLLVGGAPRHVLGRCDAEASEPARENRMSEIVAALDVATQSALTQIAGKAATLAAAVPRK